MFFHQEYNSVLKNKNDILSWCHYEKERENVMHLPKVLYPTHYVTGSETDIDYDSKEGIDAGDWIHTFSNKYAEVGQATYPVGDSLTKVTPYSVNSETKVVTVNVGVDSKQYAMIVPIFLRMNPNSSIGIADLRATANISHTDANTDGKGMDISAEDKIY